MIFRPARVKVRVVVEVAHSATWGDDCTVGQIRSQGIEHAEAAVRKALGAVGRIVSVDTVDMVVPIEPPP